jgi:hypothetical protein
MNAAISTNGEISNAYRNIDEKPECKKSLGRSLRVVVWITLTVKCVSVN